MNVEIFESFTDPQLNSITVWIIGLSGAGKSTIANGLAKTYRNKGIPTFLLDGDRIRNGLNKDLGFSLEDRRENLRRAGEIAKLVSESGIMVFSSFITPDHKAQADIEAIIGKENLILVYLSCPLDVCEKRDVKGLYKRARAGQIKNFTGIDADFEVPLKPDISIDTSKMSLDESIVAIQLEISKRIKNKP